MSDSIFSWPIAYLVILPSVTLIPVLVIALRKRELPSFTMHFLVSAIVIVAIGCFVYLFYDVVPDKKQGLLAILCIVVISIILIYLTFFTISTVTISNSQKDTFLWKHFDTLHSNPEIGLWMVLFWFIVIANFSGLTIFFIDRYERVNKKTGINIDKTLYNENRVDYENIYKELKKLDSCEKSPFELEMKFCEGSYDFIYNNGKNGKCIIPKLYSLDENNEDKYNPREIEKFRKLCKDEITVNPTDSVCEGEKNYITVGDADKNHKALQCFLKVVSTSLKNKIVYFEFRIGGYASNILPRKGRINNKELAERRAETIEKFFSAKAIEEAIEEPNNKKVNEEENIGSGKSGEGLLVPRFDIVRSQPVIKKQDDQTAAQSVRVTLTPLAPINEENRFINRRNSEDNPDATILDALYFAYYTITTTGYGDITPGSDSVKFFTTVLNVIELFFIFIIINVLVTAHANKKDYPQDNR
uniref:Ion channel n=1 Tax=Candidatus Kentrum sp. MB TaxID=2138164 RepID=A0A450XCV6_9GAMM|nr:MAG: Ion channel [Candidatus Kentron sp. MB]VFK27122.1 MAG: Ion channel [Candidatus Kentron sp. MB]VFK74898.1 MAG: Ion channel [Candidatus Kentron sp. MB]